MLKRNNKDSSGFTIIEVMIVLAIFGLIMVVVLIAIPQLQRNQRNEARRSIVARVVTEIGNYTGNNNGRIPSDTTALDGLQNRYLNGLDLRDPSTDQQFSFITDTNQSLTQNATLTAFSAIDYTADVGQYFYVLAARCNGETVEDMTGNNRNYALFTIQEGGSVLCIDNS